MGTTSITTFEEDNLNTQFVDLNLKMLREESE